MMKSHLLSQFAVSFAVALGLNLHGLPAQVVISGTINTYYKVLDVTDRGRKITVGSVSGVSAGDWMLLVQHQGASSDPEECAGEPGAVADYAAAGNFELLRVKGVVTGPPATIEFEAPTRLFYYAMNDNNLWDEPFPRGNFYGLQAVRVEYCDGDVEINGDLTAPAWDGSTGGVVALVARGTVTLRADIDVSGDGFRGGNPTANNSLADQFDFNYDPADNKGGNKGEGITDLALNGTFDAGRFSYDESAGRGALANGGGGGNGRNAGGGGGGNHGAGGNGGNQNGAENAPGTADDEEQIIGGKGGWALRYDDERRRQVFFGGGGGGGHRSADNTGTTGDSKGGSGGGIVLILADELRVDGTRTIEANGSAGANADAGNNGAGGGGAGGTILLDVNQITATGGSVLTLSVDGGAGGNTDDTDCTGPGGGGGGGAIWLRAGTAPTILTGNTSLDGGNAGTAVNCPGPSNHGSEEGEDGEILLKLSYPKWYAVGESPI